MKVIKLILILILSVIILTILIFWRPLIVSGPKVISIPTTPEAFYITEAERNALVEAVNKNHDGNAAYQLAEYYMFSANDYQTGEHWLKVASELGHKGAMEYLNRKPKTRRQP